METMRSTRSAIDEAHHALWKKFIDTHGIILDFIGDKPTPEECALGKPNAIGWFSPIEDGPMFTGLYLPAIVERARRSRDMADTAKARRLANGLIKCASVSDVPGMIVRGFAVDGRSHYPLGSDDQTHPWFLGLYAYWKSDIPTDAEKRAIVDKVREVADVLESTGWRCPCDGSFTGDFRGGFTGELFRDAARYLFMLRAVHEMTGDAVWMERYLKARDEKPGTRGLSRAAICAEGYLYDLAHFKWERLPAYQTWIYVGTQASVRHLIGFEDDTDIREYYRRGLAAAAAEAIYGISNSGFETFDNNDAKIFGASDWRAVYAQWFPQKTQEDAERLSRMRDNAKNGERGHYEHRYMVSPLAAAAIAAQAGDPAHRELIESVLRQYDYSRLNSSRFFFAECAYFSMPEQRYSHA